MQITKLGHCCLVLDVDGTKILTDPGSYTTAQNDLTGIDIVLITHEHGDHFHAESVAAVIKNNPEAKVVCNSAVAVLIKKENLASAVTVVGDGESATIKGVLIEGFGTEHALIYGDMGKCENTGYMISGKVLFSSEARETKNSDSSFPSERRKYSNLYFPGDNFEQPHKAVDVLALPVAGPWMKIAECIDFAKAIKARVAFGVHDGMIERSSRGFTGMILKKFVPDTEYVTLADGESREF